MNPIDPISLYKKLFLFRTVEEKISSEYHSQQIRCPVHLSIGQELLPAVYSTLIRQGDLAVSTHRAHLHFLAHGASAGSLFSEILGKQSGCSGGFGGSMHLVDRENGFIGSTAIVGNSLPVGVGVALAEKLKKRSTVTTVFLGDAATEEGVFFESVNFVASAQVPVLFVCENNGYSVYSKLEGRQPQGRSIAALAESIGIQAWSCDGGSTTELHRTLSSAFECVREKSQPALIEVESFRRYEHCGPAIDDDLGYRNKEEIDRGVNADPLTALRFDLANQFGRESVENWENEIRAMTNSEFEQAAMSPPAEWSDFQKVVYA